MRAILQFNLNMFQEISVEKMLNFLKEINILNKI